MIFKWRECEVLLVEEVVYAPAFFLIQDMLQLVSTCKGGREKIDPCSDIIGDQWQMRDGISLEMLEIKTHFCFI